MTEEVLQQPTLNPVSWIAWILALPLRGLAWFIKKVRTRMYDPEKIVCPACGFRGDKGTLGKTCTIKFTRTTGNEKGALQHTCYRCGANEIYTSLFLPADKWLPKVETQLIEQLKQAAAEREL